MTNGLKPNDRVIYYAPEDGTKMVGTVIALENDGWVRVKWDGGVATSVDGARLKLALVIIDFLNFLADTPKKRVKRPSKRGKKRS